MDLTMTCSIHFGNQRLPKAVHCAQLIYQVQLENGAVVMVVLYLVYAEPTNACCQTDILPHHRSQAYMQDGYQWHLVTRSVSRFTLYDWCHNNCMMLLLMYAPLCLVKPRRSQQASGKVKQF